MDNVQFAVQSILLRIRDYKKSNQIPMGTFGQVFASCNLTSLLQYEDTDEQVQIALINFYSKITYLEGKQTLETIVESVCKITSVNQLLLEKKLKVLKLHLFKFIRNAFEHPELDVPIMNSLIKMNRQIESSVPNLLIRELARDSLSQGFKRMSKVCNEELLDAALHDLRIEILQQIANRNNETVKLIEYPYSIMEFILQQRKPSQFIVQYYIPMLLELVKFDHPVIWNYLNQALLFILKLNMSGQLENDVQETRTLFGQIVLKGLTNHLNRLSSLTITDMAQTCEIDTHLFVRFLMEIFNTKEKIKYIFMKCDMNPFLKPVFYEVVSKIFELSRVAKRLQCDDGKSLQKQIYELQVQLFQVGLTKKSSQVISKLTQFINDFNTDPRSAIKQMPKDQVVNFLKYCNQFNPNLMIEILGCHKEQCISIMEQYVNTFDYSQLSLVEALRYLTSNFLLFGESQMIERVLNTFTIGYFEQNKQNTVFSHPDFLFTYTYAILLLNTDLYNKTVTKHMSLDDFKKSCAKINNGENLPNDVIVADYNSIQQDEIKCIRDFSSTEHLSQFVWDKYLSTKECTAQIYEQMKLYFEIQTDEEHYGDQILTLMVHNIEELIAQTQDVQELTTFLQQVIDICINNDKLDNAQQILVSVMKMSNEEPSMSLFAGFYIAEQLLPYTTQFQPIIQLIYNSIIQRHQMATDKISRDCRDVLRKIKINNKFTKKKMGSNEGVLQLFTQFLKQTTEEESEDEFLNDIPKFDDQQLQGAKSPNLLQNLINQTKFLDKERLNEFLGLLLESISKITDFKADYIKFAQIIYISIEILRVNTDRLLQFWSTVVSILTQRQKFDVVKKNSIKQLLSSYCGYTLLKLVIEFLHQGSSLVNYDDCFQQGLEYLTDQSLEILQEFLLEIQKFLTQNSEADFSMNFLNNIVKLLLTIFTELEKKTLDSLDAGIIMNLIQDIFEQIQRYQSETELVNILRKHLEVLNTLLKQQQLRKVSSVDGFIAKHTLQIMTTYEKYIHEQDNQFLNELLSLALNLSNDHLQKIIQIMMQVILNYNYANLKEKEFTMLFNQVASRQPQILATNNDQIVANYSQYLQKMYFNWIQKDRFQLSLWLDFLKKFGDIFQNLKSSKSPLLDTVTFSFQCVCQNQHFQDILKCKINLQLQLKVMMFQIKRNRLPSNQHWNLLFDCIYLNMQNKYKKVQNIYIELEEKSLLNSQKYETRRGLCELEGHKKKSIIKIFTINNQPDNLRMIESMRNMVKQTLSLQNNPYIVECYSQQRTQSKYYIAFKKYKNSLLSIQLDQVEILSMLASIIQLLKLFAQKGECHGNLKPTNIFPQKKLNQISSFATTDFFQFQYSNNPDQEYRDPEMNDPSIASDIYSLGKIANYTLKNRVCQFQWLIDEMINPQQNRITLEKLEIEVEKLIENYEQRGLRYELNKKGITEEFLTKIIAKGIEQHSKQSQGIEEFKSNKVEPDFALRNRAQYFLIASQEIRQCKSVQCSLIDFLILSFLSESLNCYQQCLKLTQNKVLKSIVLRDYEQLVLYLEKVNLHCELFIQDLTLKQVDTTNLSKYLSQYSKPNNLLTNALSLVIEDIINKNLGKEFKFNEEMDKSELLALNFIFYTNKMENGIIYDYKQLNEYIRCLQSIQI